MTRKRFPESMAHLESVVTDALKRRLGSAVSDIVVVGSFDSPIPTMQMTFTVYDFLPVWFGYDRGSAGFGADRGPGVWMDTLDPQGGLSSVEDVEAMVDAFAREALLWIPDKFLRARGWM